MNLLKFIVLLICNIVTLAVCFVEFLLIQNIEKSLPIVISTIALSLTIQNIISSSIKYSKINFLDSIIPENPVESGAPREFSLDVFNTGNTIGQYQIKKIYESLDEKHFKKNKFIKKRHKAKASWKIIAESNEWFKIEPGVIKKIKIKIITYPDSHRIVIFVRYINCFNFKKYILFYYKF